MLPNTPHPALQRTPLYELHCATGARMVDFGGWEMPLDYGSQIEEHHAVRRACGIFDVSHMRAVDLHGPASRDFLRRLLANDVDRLAPGKALYSCMLNPEGGVIDDLIAYRLGAPPGLPGIDYRLVVNASTARADLAWMENVRDHSAQGVQLRLRDDLALIAVQGPQARACAARAAPALAGVLEALAPFQAAPAGDAFVARTGYTGEDGCEIAVPAPQAAALWQALLQAGAVPCGLGARDTLRLEAGMNLYGNDMDAGVSPLESGLAWTVDLRAPRDFIGRAALEAQAARGALRQLLGLKLQGRGVLRAHQTVRTPLGEGMVTSGTFSPTLDGSIALARLPAGVRVGDTVAVALRAGPAPALVCRLPFVRHGKALA
jgi:aminomethyltransferase